MDLFVKCVESLRPQRSVVREPRVALDQGTELQRVDPALTVGAHLDEAGLTQDPQMARDGWLTQLEVRRELARALVAFREHLNDAAPGGIRQGAELVHADS